MRPIVKINLVYNLNGHSDPNNHAVPVRIVSTYHQDENRLYFTLRVADGNHRLAYNPELVAKIIGKEKIACVIGRLFEKLGVRIDDEYYFHYQTLLPEHSRN